MPLTEKEKNSLLNHVQSLLNMNVINRDDRKKIYKVLLAACRRDLKSLLDKGVD